MLDVVFFKENSRLNEQVVKDDDETLSLDNNLLKVISAKNVRAGEVPLEMPHFVFQHQFNRISLITSKFSLITVN